MTDKFLIDERMRAVANESYRFAFMVLQIGILVIVIVRGWAYGQSCWDLMGLLIGSGMVATVYQRTKHVSLLPRGRLLWIMLIGGVVGGIVATALMTIVRLAVLKR